MENFEKVVEQYEAMIWKVIHSLHIYKNKEEFFQIGLIALWEAQNRFDQKKGKFTSYAYSYIRGRILTELTKINTYDERSIFPKEEFWELLKDDHQQNLLEKEIIQSYCSNLTEKQQKWVLYTALHDLTIKEIAKIEQVSISAVKAWRKGAKEKLLVSCTLRGQFPPFCPRREDK